MYTDTIIPMVTRAMVWDDRLYKNDKDTPDCWRPATIALLREDVCDVIFDHRPGRVSHGHFTSVIRIIKDPI